MIELAECTKFFETSSIRTTAVKEVTLRINSGEFTAIMGPSGCGKTTLLSAIGMIQHFDSGNYRLFDREVSSISSSEIVTLRAQHIGFVFQNFNLIETLTVSENVAVSLLYRGFGKTEVHNMCSEVLERVGVAHRANHYPYQLSGGQQQRVAVARAIIGKKSLILADEPTGNLDSTSGSEIMDLLKEINQLGTTIIMVTHNPDHTRFATRVVNMNDGALVS